MKSNYVNKCISLGFIYNANTKLITHANIAIVSFIPLKAVANNVLNIKVSHYHLYQKTSPYNHLWFAQIYLCAIFMILFIIHAIFFHISCDLPKHNRFSRWVNKLFLPKNNFIKNRSISRPVYKNPSWIYSTTNTIAYIRAQAR